MRIVTVLSYAAIVATLSACKPAADKTKAGDSAATARAGRPAGAARGDSTTMMGGSAGMASMAGRNNTRGVMDSMETRLRAMDMMSATQIEATLPAHRQAAADMLSQMSAEMQSMHVSPSMNWSATADSIRQDFSHMTGMNGARLKASMPAYHARMTRLMDMHRQMMANTKP